MATDSPARASTEDWCETGPRHVWSYRSHAGTPRVETRTCMACGFLSVEPVRELLRAAPAGTGGPTPAPDEEPKASWLRRIEHLADENARLRRKIEEVSEGARLWGADVAAKIAERDAARAELSQVQKERDALKLAAGLTADTVVSFAVGAIRNMLDTAHVARTQLRPQIARLEADLADAQRDLAAARDRLDANGVIPDRYDAAISERDEARSALAALRAEVGAAFKQADLIVETFAVAAPWNGAGLYSAVRGLHAALRALVTDQSPAAPPIIEPLPMTNDEAAAFLAAADGGDQ